MLLFSNPLKEAGDSSIWPSVQLSLVPGTAAADSTAAKAEESAVVAAHLHSTLLYVARWHTPVTPGAKRASSRIASEAGGA